jgi:hypothetical protein
MNAGGSAVALIISITSTILFVDTMEVDYSKVMDRVKFWKKTIESSKEFTGTSPPSVFVGRQNYPNVFFGVLAPPIHQESSQAAILDSPELWYANRVPLDRILNYRGQMIYSRFRASVKSTPGRLGEVAQEVAMAKRPADIEVELKKHPTFRMKFDTWAAPIGNPAIIQDMRLTENPSVERKVDYLIADTDFKAQEAVAKLYHYNIPVSRIQKIFSAGLLGVRFQRRLTPTRWSITAVDDILGKSVVEKVKEYQQLGEFRLFSNEYLGNHYEILLIPGSYEYELVEAWDVNSPMPSVDSDYERSWLRTEYATHTHGAFYSGRLAVGEYLKRIKRQAAALIVREVRPEYYAPLGIWQLRETVRGAFTKPFDRPAMLEEAIAKICSRLMIGKKWLEKSELIRSMREQTRIKQFLKA